MMKKVSFTCPEDLHERLQDIGNDTGLGVPGVVLLTLRKAAGMTGSAGNFGVLTAPRKQPPTGGSNKQDAPSDDSQTTTGETPPAEEKAGSTTTGTSGESDGQVHGDDAPTTKSEDRHESDDAAQTQAGDSSPGGSGETPSSLKEATSSVEASNGTGGVVPTTPAGVVEQGPAVVAPSPAGSNDKGAPEGTPQPAPGGLKDTVSGGASQQTKAASEPRPAGTGEESKPAERSDQRQASVGPGQGPAGSGQKGEQPTLAAGATPGQRRSR